MKTNKILYWVGLACLATILPLSLPIQPQSEVFSQNAIEINKQTSTRDGQNQELKSADKRDHDSDDESEDKHDHESEHEDRDDSKSDDRDRHSRHHDDD